MNPRSVVLIAGLSLVILHRIDGGEVLVAPAHITSMHDKSPGGARDKLTNQDARCIVWLADGRMLSVLEPCDVVRKLVNGMHDEAK